MAELPPATLEGWYVLHQMVRVDWGALRALDGAARGAVSAEAVALRRAQAASSANGWSGAYHIVGGGVDVMFVHFRDTLDALGEVELQQRRSRLYPLLRMEYEFTSITEVGLYHATVEAAEEAEPGSEAHQKLLGELAAAERASAHVQTRLFPKPPDEFRYVSFYPMNKRRADPHNWYTLPVADRNLLMREHGLTGRKYAGRVFQVITGSVGFDDWEWGVTLFAKDPLEFKRIVTEMRYDDASARYAEFGEFFTGFRLQPEEFAAALSLD